MSESPRVTESGAWRDWHWLLVGFCSRARSISRLGWSDLGFVLQGPDGGVCRLATIAIFNLGKKYYADLRIFIETSECDWLVHS
jgi:hypothetical protein